MKIEVHCVKHRGYKVLKQPTSNCMSCHQLWNFIANDCWNINPDNSALCLLREEEGLAKGKKVKTLL